MGRGSGAMVSLDRLAPGKCICAFACVHVCTYVCEGAWVWWGEGLRLREGRSFARGHPAPLLPVCSVPQGEGGHRVGTGGPVLGASPGSRPSGGQSHQAVKTAGGMRHGRVAPLQPWVGSRPTRTPQCGWAPEQHSEAGVRPGGAKAGHRRAVHCWGLRTPPCRRLARAEGAGWGTRKAKAL